MNASWTAYLPGMIREWLDGRMQLQKAISNTGWLVFERVIRMVIGLTVGAWTARYLGPARFGELAYVLSFIAFFQILSDLQTEGFVIRDISQERAPAGVILGTALRLRLLASFLSWIAAVGLMALLHRGEPELILLTAVVGAMLVFQATDIFDCWFQSQSQSKRTVKAKLISYLVSNGLKVVLLLTGAPLIAFAAVMAVEGGIFACALVMAYRRFPTATRWSASKTEATRLFHLCWPFVISGLMITAYMRVDQIMLKEMLGEKELGIYAAALPLAQVWNVIPTTLVASLAPFVARKKSRGEAEYQEALVIIFRIFAIVSLLGACLTALLSPWLIELLYGPAYQEAARVLALVVFMIVFVFQGLAQSMWVVNDSVRAVNVISTAVAAAVSIASNALLIRHYGILGAACSCILGQATAVVIIPCLLRRDLRELYGRAFLGAASHKTTVVDVTGEAHGSD
jgi:O-antigen/teichoic acid export membrane protein